MLELTKQELDKYHALTPKISPHVQSIMDSIPFPNVPERMKAVIALAQLTTFSSQFRRNVYLWDDTSVPVNAISFVVTGSGDNKDSSVKAARKCFGPGYELILQQRERAAIAEAINLASANGEDPADQPEIYESYHKPLPPIDIMPTTGPGFIQHVNDIGEHPITAGFLYSGEFGDELSYNQDMLENIKILSELYDTGDKEIKYTKGVEHRSKAISGQPVSALLVTSPTQILYDEATAKKFNVAFMSKLARRAWFCYTPEKLPLPDFDSMEKMYEYEEKLEISAKQSRESMKSKIISIAQHNLQHAGIDLQVTEDIFKLFKTYKRYNTELADLMPNQHSTAVLVRRHLQWKAIKLAGALAIFDKSHSVEAHHYVDAIRFCELLSNDMAEFEAQLNKSHHEQFADYMQTIVKADGTADISLHELKKRGFITSTAIQKLKELVTLANAYDHSGIYSVSHDGSSITLELIIKTEEIGISYKEIDISNLTAATLSGDSEAISKAKQAIAATTVYGYEVADTKFPQLSDLLAGSYAYSPFKFKDNTRGKDHILGGTKWLVLDVDDSNLTASEAHFMLSDINHHIALTSDPNNEFKFRILLELDAVVDLNPIMWKSFYLSIAKDLALKVDPLPQSQIFYSYPDRDIYSTLDAEPLEVKDYLLAAQEHTTKSPTMVPAKQAQALLADPLETFNYAFEANDGAGSRSLIRAAYHAKDLGASQEQIIELMHEINDYWIRPLDEERLQNTIIAQIERAF